MKQPAVALFILFLIGCSPAYDVPRKIPKQAYTPPGTVWLRGNLFIDKTEMTNTDYREFLYWSYRHHVGKSYWDSLLPDTSVWGNINIHGMRASSYYFRHPRFSEYPVVGISYHQAVEYCKWRTDRVNELLYILKNHIKWSPDSVYNAPKVVNYRLPTAEEWEYAASAGLEYCKYPLGYERILDKHNAEVSNTAEYNNLFLLKSGCYVHLNEGTDSAYFEDYTQPVLFGKPNKFRVYNMLGNVSEIIADSLYKGLNYQDFIEKSGIFYQPFPYNYKVTYKYKKPQQWLGFRCVCEVLKQ